LASATIFLIPDRDCRPTTGAAARRGDLPPESGASSSSAAASNFSISRISDCSLFSAALSDPAG
jgi:hypothetical protein